MPGRSVSGTARVTRTPTTLRTEQQYLPDDLDGKVAYYRPTDRGFEERLRARLEWLTGRLGRRRPE